MPNLLYQRWLDLCESRPDALALVDLTDEGRTWTFGQIRERVRRMPSVPGLVAPAGFSTSLVFSTLRAWRDDLLLCPVDEKTQKAPLASKLKGLPEAVRHLKITSGSTGVARLVMFRPEQLLADVDQIAATMGLSPSMPNLGAISMAHSYGFSNLVLPLLIHGVPLVWVGGFFPEAVGEALEGPYAPFALPAVPAMWRAWAATGILGGGIRLAISAGAPLGVDLERDVYRRFGLKIHNFYGSSECGGIAYDASETPREDGSFVGMPLRGVTLTTTAENCLEIRSSAVAEGYWPQGEDGAGHLPAIRGGVFTSGDVAELLPGKAGVRLLGRADDLINVAGRKISPASIERILQGHADLRCCLVFGVPSADPSRGEEIVACVNPGDQAPGKAAFLEALKADVAEHLAPFERPRHWWLCRDLAPDARGKLSRAQWRSKYLAHSRQDKPSSP